MPRRVFARRMCGAIPAMIALLPFGGVASAQQADMIRPTIHATRIDTADAPTIDGNLSDPIWARAGVIDDFRQKIPDPGAPATERTELRILYDENNIYFAVYAYDNEPDLVISRTMARDGNLNTGDSFRIYLDPGMTRRNGYSFEIGPTGGRSDALIENNTNYLTEWDTIWQANARRVVDGWTGEIAIPFRSLSYERGRTEWGFDAARLIRRKAELVRWTSYSPEIPLQDISRSGTLTGIANIREGIGLDVRVYGRFRFKHDGPAPQRDALSGATGAEAYYKVTPSLTGTLTLNPDFSDSPLDKRQVNTSRFSLFTPETRAFFLQDAVAFEFGGRNFQNRNNSRPFFSRNIGLVDGRPVTIMAGGKLSGSYNDTGIGAISVVTNETSTTPRQVLSVLRVTRPVLAQSKIGFIVTNGDPTGASENTLADADFQYRNTNVLGGKVFQADFAYQRSFSSTVGEDDAIGIGFYYPNEPWGGELRYKHVGSRFDPALGFVARPNIKNYVATVTRRARFQDQYLRSFRIEAQTQLVTNFANETHTLKNQVTVAFANRYADTSRVGVINRYEFIPTAFNLPGGVVIPAGGYQWTNIIPYIDTTQGRAVVFALGVECCSYYDGDYLAVETEIRFRYGDRLEIVPSFEAEFFDMPTGYVGIQIYSLSTFLSITPTMQLITQTQYDNISRNFGFSARYFWEYSPGNELFIGIGQTALITRPNQTFLGQVSEFSIRMGRTFRF